MLKDIDVVVVGVPNHLHREIVVAAAEAGKHIVLKKPLAHTLEAGRAMVEAGRKHGVKLMCAETICFSPKYARTKQRVEEGAIGKMYMTKQGEKRSGPHSDRFYDNAPLHPMRPE